MFKVQSCLEVLNDYTWEHMHGAKEIKMHVGSKQIKTRASAQSQSPRDLQRTSNINNALKDNLFWFLFISMGAT